MAAAASPPEVRESIAAGAALARLHRRELRFDALPQRQPLAGLQRDDGDLRTPSVAGGWDEASIRVSPQAGVHAPPDWHP